MEGYLREKELKTCIWGKESIIVIDEDIEISKNVVVSKLSWIEEHKDEIIEFALASVAKKSVLKDILRGDWKDYAPTLRIRSLRQK